MNTQEANHVLIDRCERKIANNNGCMCPFVILSILTHAQVLFFILDGATWTDPEFWLDPFWILYFIFGILFPIFFCFVQSQNALVKQTKRDAENRLCAEEGGYTLHRPGAKADVGAAACGDLYYR